MSGLYPGSKNLPEGQRENIISDDRGRRLGIGMKAHLEDGK